MADIIDMNLRGKLGSSDANKPAIENFLIVFKDGDELERSGVPVITPELFLLVDQGSTVLFFANINQLMFVENIGWSSKNESNPLAVLEAPTTVE